MPSWTEIANLALVSLGESPISDIDENSAAAVKLRAVRDMVRDEVLRSHPWNCATKRVQLAAMAAAPAWGFTAQFDLPADYLGQPRLEDPDIDHQVEDDGANKVMMAATDGPLNLAYVWRNNNPGRYDASLATAIALRWAAAVAYGLTQSHTKEEAAWKKYNEFRPEARSHDAFEQTPPALLFDEFEKARD